MTEKTTITTTKILELFESEYTEQLYDRKANTILKFCKERKEGFYYDEIEDLTKIIKYAVRDLGDGVMEMKTVIKKLCENCSLPFKKNKASDEFNYSKALPAFLDAFRPVLVTPKLLEANMEVDEAGNLQNSVINNVTEDLRLAVIDFVYAFVNEGIDETKKSEESYEEKKVQGVESSPMLRLIQNGTKNLRAFDQADLAENIVYLMQSYTQHQDLSHVLEVICVCGIYSKLAHKFVNFGTLKDIINVIFETADYRSYIVKLGFEIIWNFIESVGVACLKSIATEDIINNLKRLFENIMKTGYKLEDKGLRNELLILINYLMSDDSALYYFYEKQTLPTHNKLHTFLEIVLYYSTIDEMTFYTHPIRTNEMRAYFNTTSEDLEFKKLIWSGILTSLQSNQLKVVETVKNSPFISALILYIDPLANSYAVNRWSAPQLREIQLHCLSILANLILYMKEEFYDKNGLFALTKFLTNTTDTERREKCLKAFANASLFDEEIYKLKISDEGIVDILLDFIQTESDSGLEIKESCFSILSNLCKNCVKNKKLFRKKSGIDLIISSLRDVNIGISSRYALYTIAVLDCLWNAVLGYRKNEIWFLENEGFYVLMEFLETASDLPRKMCLSCLSNLIENPKCISYFCDWNSTRTMINSTQLLIKLYEKEDVKYGVKYRNGILQDFDRPLNPKTRKVKTTNDLASKYGLSQGESRNQVIDDEDGQPEESNQKRARQQLRHETLEKIKGFARLKDALLAGENDTSAGTEAYLVKKLVQKAEKFDLRAIIFAILYRTGFDRNEVEPHERQVLEAIQLYPQFKMGEIWTDIKFELEEERIKPTSDDYHWMMTNIEEIEDKIISCVSTQSLIAKQERKIQEEELSKFFEIIRSNKLNK